MRSIAKAGKMTDKPSRTVGIDLGDRFCSYCILNQDGDACRVRAPNHLFGYQAHYPPPGFSMVNEAAVLNFAQNYGDILGVLKMPKRREELIHASARETL
jgi:hypothetical protein